MKTKFTIVLVLLAFFSACGDDDSNSTQRGSYHSITSDTISQYQHGDHLQYNFVFKRNDIVINRGVEDVFIFRGLFFPQIDEEVYDQATYFNGRVNGESHDYFYYDAKGNWIHYITDNGTLYVNPLDPSDGALAMPAVISVGKNWTNESVVLRFDSVLYAGSMEYHISTKGTVLVPMGSVEAYRINYSGTFTQEYSYNPYFLNIKGEIWVNPQIGVIKTYEEVKQTGPFNVNYYFTNQLVSISWEI